MDENIFEIISENLGNRWCELAYSVDFDVSSEEISGIMSSGMTYKAATRRILTVIINNCKTKNPLKAIINRLHSMSRDDIITKIANAGYSFIANQSQYYETLSKRHKARCNDLELQICKLVSDNENEIEKLRSELQFSREHLCKLSNDIIALRKKNDELNNVSSQYDESKAEIIKLKELSNRQNDEYEKLMIKFNDLSTAPSHQMQVDKLEREVDASHEQRRELEIKNGMLSNDINAVSARCRELEISNLDLNAKFGYLNIMISDPIMTLSRGELFNGIRRFAKKNKTKPLSKCTIEFIDMISILIDKFWRHLANSFKLSATDIQALSAICPSNRMKIRTIILIKSRLMPAFKIEDLESSVKAIADAQQNGLISADDIQQICYAGYPSAPIAPPEYSEK